jgi:hypothetical protein
MSFKFGLYSPTVIVGLIFALTLVFDIMGLIYYTSQFPHYLSTMIIGVVLFGLVIREVTNPNG